MALARMSSPFRRYCSGDGVHHDLYGPSWRRNVFRRLFWSGASLDGGAAEAESKLNTCQVHDLRQQLEKLHNDSEQLIDEVRRGLTRVDRLGLSIYRRRVLRIGAERRDGDGDGDGDGVVDVSNKIFWINAMHMDKDKAPVGKKGWPGFAVSYSTAMVLESMHYFVVGFASWNHIFLVYL